MQSVSSEERSLFKLIHGVDKIYILINYHYSQVKYQESLKNICKTFNHTMRMNKVVYHKCMCKISYFVDGDEKCIPNLF